MVMVKDNNTINASMRKGGHKVAVSLPLERTYKQAKQDAKVIKARRCLALPAVNADSADLDDLFAWGKAVAEQGHITPEMSDQLKALIREQDAKGRR